MELPKEEKDAKKTQHQELPQLQEPPQQGKEELAKELSAVLPVLGESTSRRVAGMEEKEPKVLVIASPDEDRKKAIVFFLKKLDLEPLLVEGADGQGTDLSQKYEMHAEAAFAVTLLTGDDMGFPEGKPEKPKPRPTQE